MRKPLKRGNDTKEKILKTGIKLWLKDPSQVTASEIGRVLGVSHSLILYHFPKALKTAVAQYALDTENLKLISVLIASNHNVISKLSQETRKHYIQRIWGGF